MFTWLDRWFSNRKRTQGELFDLSLGVEAEKFKAGLDEVLAEVGMRKLETLATVLKDTEKLDDGSEVMKEAIRLFREGMASAIARPAFDGFDREERQAEFARPFVGLTGSSKPSEDGETPASKALPNGTTNPALPSPTSSSSESGSESPEPRRRRGRPKGSRNKPRGGEEPPRS